jgi:hypothetical protein
MVSRLALILGCWIAALGLAHGQAVSCPPDAKSCKVLVITADEENTLVGPEMIFDHAQWANQVKFSGMVRAWRQKIEQAPLGKPMFEPQPPK